MTVFRGQRVKRAAQSTDWETMAQKAIMSGGRLVQSGSGDLHLVSPGGKHWGSFNTRQGTYAGGTLSQMPDDDEYRDVTDQFFRG